MGHRVRPRRHTCHGYLYGRRSGKKEATFRTCAKKGQKKERIRLRDGKRDDGGMETVQSRWNQN